MAVNKPFTVSGIKVVSPKGFSKWCKVKEPERNFNAKGTYSTLLVCNPDEPAVKLFIEKLEELRDAAFKEAKETLKPAQASKLIAKQVYAEEYDAEGNPTGNIEFKFKLDNVDDKQKGKNTIEVVDSQRKIIKDIPLIGNGSTIRCMAYANPYYMANGNTIGVSLLWKSMQLIDLLEFSGASDFDEEDGYTGTSSKDTSDYDDEEDTKEHEGDY